jgi:hypothetical protein
MRQNFNIFAGRCQGKLTAEQQTNALSFSRKWQG